jgi:glycosyltransferase involved in cell wall biosynthesis
MAQKRTIAIVAHDVGGNGGMERHLEEVILRLKKDMEVIVVASSMQLRDGRGVRFIRIPAIKRPFPLMMLLFALLGTVRLLFVKRDLLHTTGAIVFNRADFSTIHFCHEGFIKATGDSRSRNNHSFWRRLNSSLATRVALWMEKAIYRPKRTGALVAVSFRVQSELLEAFPYQTDQVPVIPNGVDIDKFIPYTPEMKTILRKSFGIPVKSKVLLFMGGDWPRKGLEEVIQAFNLIAGEFPDVCLLVVGTGDQQKYSDLVHAKYKHRVTFMGKQPNPQEWFGISDIFIAPSSYETFSLVVHEAAAAGLVILSTKVGGVEDFIEQAVNGYYIERSAESIASRLTEVLNDFDGSRKCGIKAREKVESMTWDRTYQKFSSLYHSEIGSSGIGHFHTEISK